MAETPATNATDPNAPAPQRRAAVLVLIAVVATLFLLLFAILWYRSWWKQPVAPSARLVVEGGEEHEGMLIRIAGSRLARPLEARIRKEDDYVVIFSLPPGSYSIRITRDGRPYFERRAFHLPQFHRAHVSLKSIDEAQRKAASNPM